MLKIGSRSTKEATLRIKNIEVHIFDFDQKIYNQTVTISFVKRIRDEKKFYGLEELSQQLIKDKKEIRKLFLID